MRNTIYENYFNKMKRGARKRKLSCTVDANFIKNLYKKQLGKCAYTGLEISLEKYTASLDRIDSSKGYTKRNVQWVHKTINTMKFHYSEREFLRMCELVVNNVKCEVV